MKAIEFPEVNTRIAEHQEEYITLPAFNNSWEGSMVCCFELSDDELAEVIKSKRFWLKVYTFGAEFPPICPSVFKDELIVPPSNITVIYGPPRSGKTNVLNEIEKQCKALRLIESELDKIVFFKNRFTHLLIDEAVGTDQLLLFVEKHRATHKIVIATQNQDLLTKLGHISLVQLPIPS